LGVCNQFILRKKVVSVFVRFRALHSITVDDLRNQKMITEVKTENLENGKRFLYRCLKH
jgi:hypothetical protein